MTARVVLPFALAGWVVTLVCLHVALRNLRKSHKLIAFWRLTAREWKDVAFLIVCPPDPERWIGYRNLSERKPR